MITRQSRNDVEAQGEQTIAQNDIESTEANFKSFLRKFLILTNLRLILVQPLQVQPYENTVEKLDERLKHDESIRKEKARNDKLNEESIIRYWMRQEEQEAENNKRIREEKFALQLEEKKLEIAEKKRVKPKSPDLQISKFQGTYLDWERFWILFSTQIDQKSIPDEAKFSYLKELVIPRYV